MAESKFAESKYLEERYLDSKDSRESNRLIPRITISNNTSEVFCVRFSPDGKFLAAGCGDGAIRVFNTDNGHLSYNLQSGSNVALPTTCIRFRPATGAASRTKNVFIASNAAGTVQHWHMTSGKCLHSTDDHENQVYALDYNSEGSQFATAGKDTAIRIYDEATKTLVTTMQGGTGYSITKTPGHSNRIFSCKFVPSDENLVISGGWDNTVQVWDIRLGAAVRSIYGAHICGDSLDIFGNEVLTGSWRPDNQLEIWDFGTGEKICDIPWNTSVFSSSGQPACMLYTAQFSKEGHARYIVAGGSGANEAKVFDHMNDNRIIGTITGLSRGVFASDFSPDNNKVAIAGGDASIRILEVGV
jgi:WD40 repeat protein